ncbi:hypothetical protein [Clostridium sp. BSD9I1]|uniref:hypothetical protein n=1 Tax=Clostridium sp. BSD9I1 TaxID=2003589 RepID=UPI00164497DA|nr:hypothetical protein [Clostridium sp. BSD9I1]
MGKRKEISVTVNCSKDDKSLEELNYKKVEIVINILKEKYGDVVLEEYINSIKENRDNYS